MGGQHMGAQLLHLTAKVKNIRQYKYNNITK